MPNSIETAILQFNNIPSELKLLKQWMLWKYVDIGAAKPTKEPFQPNNLHASVTNPATWSTFDEVLNAYKSGNFSGIGFVFSADDPYCFVDLDKAPDAIVLERQRKVFNDLNSYSELSPSGEGLHIICKAVIPHGRKRSSIEVYSSARYATFTGNIYHNVSINHRQSEIQSLWEQLGNSASQNFIFKGDAEEKITDDEVIRIACEAVNGEKASDLFKGNWQSYYPSQSEADFSLINIIAFYTKNRFQIARIFRNSALGQRDKAKREDYLSWMINRSFDRELPPIDMEGLKINVEDVINNNRPVAQGLEPTAHNGLVAGSNPAGPTNNFNNGVSVNGKPSPFEGDTLGSNPSAPTKSKIKPTHVPPPGLLGEIAQFIYSAAPRPVPEIAIAAAIGLMAGICGRAYNVSSTGLNQYVLLLAKTGRGKEAIQSGISKLIYAVRQQVPTIEECIGPDEIASGPALYKYLAKNPGFVSVLSEFGLRLQQLSDLHGNGANVSLRRMILQLYAKSGFNDVAHPSIYSDKDKNVAAIASPAFSILGESTPHTFYKNLNEEMISEGLLPRFLLIEYEGNRVDENVNHAQARPSFELIDKLAAIAANAATVENAQPRRVITVNFTEAAFELSKKYSKQCDQFINNKENNEILMELWNRAHLKVLKLAALVAVGINMWNPTIEVEHLQWAIDMVNDDISKLKKRFESGRIGANTVEVKQIDEIIKAMKEYATNDWPTVAKYATAKDKKLHDDKVIAYSYLSRKLIAMAAFRNDKIGATNAIKRTLQTLLDRDYIQEIPRDQLKAKYGTGQKSYMITNMVLLNDDED